MTVREPWVEALRLPLAEAKAALGWRGQMDDKLACLDPWTFAKVRRVEQALESLVQACESTNSQERPS